MVIFNSYVKLPEGKPTKYVFWTPRVVDFWLTPKPCQAMTGPAFSDSNNPKKQNLQHLISYLSSFSKNLLLLYL
jgi:hypothetical protein